jgi:hypothetical protein
MLLFEEVMVMLSCSVMFENEFMRFLVGKS